MPALWDIKQASSTPVHRHAADAKFYGDHAWAFPGRPHFLDLYSFALGLLLLIGQLKSKSN
jgi:hypothetical protein